MKTLLIIDMQPRFSSANDQRTIDGVVALVRKAKRNKWAILVVEFRSAGGESGSSILYNY